MKYYLLLFCIIHLSCKKDKKIIIESTPKIEIKKPKKIEKLKTVLKQEFSLNISIEKIQFRGLKLKDSKSKMIRQMGVSDSIVEPKYDCGPFSEDWQKTKFYQYFYGNTNFIVFKEFAEIQDIKFVKNEKIKINGKIIGSGMNFEQVSQILGIDLKKGSYSNERIILNPKEQLDEFYILKFKDNILFRFDRFEPC